MALSSMLVFLERIYLLVIKAKFNKRSIIYKDNIKKKIKFIEELDDFLLETLFSIFYMIFYASIIVFILKIVKIC